MKEINLKLKKLKTAIEQRNVVKIINCYEELEKIDWDNMPDKIFEKYTALVDRGNNIIY